MSSILNIIENAAQLKNQSASNDYVRFYDLSQKIIASVLARPDLKGEKGDPGPSGPQGKEGMQGKDGLPGQDGLPGTNGKNGKDGTANIDEVHSIVKRSFIEHENEFDHTLIHDSHFLGGKEFDEDTAADGKILQISGKKIICIDLPKNMGARGRRDWFPSDGVGLPGQAGNSGKFLTTDGTTSSWASVTSPISYADKEVPSGNIDDANVTFTFAHTPTAGSDHVFLNGVLQNVGAGNDYTISGATVTFATAPPTGSIVLASYRY